MTTKNTEVSPPTVEGVRVASAEVLPEIKALLERQRGLRGWLSVHFPEERESTAMLHGRRPPSMAWVVHNLLEEVVSYLESVVHLLDQVEAAKESDVLADWLRNQCDSDHIRPRFGLFNLAAESRRTLGDDALAAVPLPTLDDDTDSVLWQKAMRRGAMVDLAQQLYRARTGEELEIPERKPQLPVAPPGCRRFGPLLKMGVVGW